ncbi:MAG: hypothetical protein PHD29_04660 [bacterium]|nr:hypothetical protein [bacterium]MDD5756249.1 hypothetical protein [bacterium]
MKSLKVIALMLLLAIVPLAVTADVGPPIPEPKVDISIAIKLATNAFKKEISKETNPYVKFNNFILVSVMYTNAFKERDTSVWAWKVTFVHTRNSDFKYIYKVDNPKTAVLIDTTE